jgi:hypothetical protein
MLEVGISSLLDDHLIITKMSTHHEAAQLFYRPYPVSYFLCEP